MTRSGGPDCRLAVLLRGAGANPVQIPLTRTVPPSSGDELVQELPRLLASDWLVVTSARAVPFLVAALEREGTGVAAVRLRGVKVCAVGPETAKGLRTAGFEPALVPGRFLAEGVAEALVREGVGPGTRVFFPRAEEGREAIPRLLGRVGAEVRVVSAYRTEPIPENAARLVRLLEERRCDVVTFTAASATAAFADALVARKGRGPGPGLQVPGAPGIIALGPSTAAALAGRGMHVDRTAEPHTFEGLLEAVSDWVRSPGRSRDRE